MHEPCIDLDIFPLFRNSFILLYGLAAIALWHAPIYGWALLISGWARRATFLWAILPFFARAFSRRSHSARRISPSCLKDRLMGFAPRPSLYNMHSVNRAHNSPPGTIPELARSLARTDIAAVFLAAAVRLRRLLRAALIESTLNKSTKEHKNHASNRQSRTHRRRGVFINGIYRAPSASFMFPISLSYGATPPRLQATFLLTKRFSGFRSSVILLGRSFSFASPSRSIGY